MLPYFSHFLFCTIISSGLIIIILLIKHLLKKHLSERWQYHIGFISLFLLSVPVLPPQLFDRHISQPWFPHPINLLQSYSGNIAAPNTATTAAINHSTWLQDFTVSVNHAIPGYLMLLLMIVWIAGMVAFTMVTLSCSYQIRRIKKSVQPLHHEVTERLFEQCTAQIGLKKKIRLGISPYVHTPITFGLFAACIVLPEDIFKQLSQKDIRYILLHELNHCKSKDILVNYILCFFQILYWFNPFAWLAFKEIKTDREIACDLSVLKLLDKSCYIDYGKTIINFADKQLHKFSLSITANIGGSGRQIRKRIEKIASFSPESRVLSIKSIAIFILTGLLMLKLIPVYSAATHTDSNYAFHASKVEYEDLSAYFNTFNGCFVLYDLQSDQYKIYNKEKSLLRVSPASTYKIFSALFALESNAITPEQTNLDWNGTYYPYGAWNADQNLSSAIQNSVSWYFQALDMRVGLTQLQDYFKRIHYGNYDLSGGISDYWMESSLRISPVEQVQALKDLYINKYKFEQTHIDAVKKVLQISKKNDAVLYGKTGTGTINNKNTNGWFIGYVENNEKVYFFATNLQNKDLARGSTAAEITLSILKDKKIY